MASNANPRVYPRGEAVAESSMASITRRFAILYFARGGDGAFKEREELGLEVGLIKRELARMRDFGELANNPAETDRLVSQIEEAYGLNKIGMGGDFDDI